MLQGNWSFPTKIHFGAGAISDIASICAETGISRALLVTDEGTAGLPFIGTIRSLLVNGGIEVDLFTDVLPNPTEKNVLDGVIACRANACDAVIAVGGGSGIDAGKAVALMVGQERPLTDFEDVGDNWRRVAEDRILPCIAIPTTAGTGSEVGRASVIVDTLRHEKKIIFHPRMMPDAVICDPELTVGLPRALTAATGIDAFTHCFEAFCAPGYHPIADGIALKGMQLVAQWLPVAYKDGANIEARSHMMAAATMGAAAFQKGLGAVHAISHAIGGLYNTHHGLTNAVVLPYVVVRNRAALESKVREIAIAVGLQDLRFDAFLNWILEFRSALDIPHDVQALGVEDRDIETLVDKSANDPALGGNPIELTKHDLRELIQNAIDGALNV